MRTLSWLILRSLAPSATPAKPHDADAFAKSISIRNSVDGMFAAVKLSKVHLLRLLTSDLASAHIVFVYAYLQKSWKSDRFRAVAQDVRG